MINRELLHVYNESVRICQTKFTDWTPQQTVVVATDPTVPDLPVLQAVGCDQAVDLQITPPTQNVDKDTGTVFPTANFPVNDLREYVIYFSTSANIDSNSDGVPDDYDGSFTVEAHNTKDSRKSFPCTVKYWFVATCGDKHGNVSICSSEVNATPIASGYAPSVVDYGNNLEGVYEGRGIIALKLQPPKSDWEKGGGYIVYFDEKTSGGSWPSPATWTYLYHGLGPIVLHKQLESDSGSGDFRLYKYKVRVFAQGADLTNVTDDSQLSLDNTSGEVTSGTIDDGVASAGYDPSQANNAALIAETIIAERFLGNEFVGQTFAGGIFRSTNWGPSAGSEFDASAGTLKLGGSSSPAFSVSAAGAVACSNITITGGSLNINSGAFTVSAAGAMACSSVTITGGTLNINSGVFSVSAAGAVVASSISCTNLSVGAGSSWGGNALGTAYIPNLNCDKITSGTFGTVRIPNLSCSKITSGTFDAVRIPNLSATKITTDTMSANRISGGTIGACTISATYLTTGTLDANKVNIVNLTVTGVITCQAGSSYAGNAISTSYTSAKCTNASADQTSASQQPYSWITGTKPPTDADKTKTIIDGGLITTGYINISSGGYIKSSNYSAGSAGFIVYGSGSAEFNTVTVRGALIAGSGSSVNGAYLNNINANTITAGTITGRVIRTAASGARVQIDVSGGTAHYFMQYDASKLRTSISSGAVHLMGTGFGQIDLYSSTINRLNMLNLGGKIYASGGVLALETASGQDITLNSGDDIIIDVADADHPLYIKDWVTAGGAQGTAAGRITLISNGITRYLRLYT